MVIFKSKQKKLEGNFLKKYAVKDYVLLKVLNAYNAGQNIWDIIEKSSKTGQDKKSLTSTFACFLIATAKV